jgi:hypothetical protein
MTPTSTLDNPVVIENAPAAPEAIASAAESSPASVRVASSGTDTSNGHKKPDHDGQPDGHDDAYEGGEG